jgi:hypothetical protein
VFLSEGPAYTITTGDVDYTLYGEVEVPSNILPSGYYPPIRSTPTGVVQGPGPRDGTYDTGGRSLFLTASQDLQGELRDCFPNTFTNTFGPGSGSTSTYTGVVNISVQNLDFTVSYSKNCTDPTVFLSVPAIIVSATTASGTTIVFNGFGYTRFPIDESLTYNVSGRQLAVTFSDDPGNPVPLESLPRLS